MARFKVTSSGKKDEVEASSWISALGQVLERFSLGGKEEQVLCELGPEGELEVTDSLTGTQVTVSSVELKDVPTSPPRFSDDPTTEFWDPPSLERLAVFAAREDLGKGDLDKLTNMCGEIDSAITVEAASELSLDILMACVPAESASVLLLEDGVFRFVAARGPRADALVGQTMPQTEGIAGIAASRGTGLLVREAARTDIHYGKVDEKVQYHTRTLLAVPMVNDTAVLGVIELLNPFGSVDFADWHKVAAERVGRRLAARVATC